ncbi:MAG: gliding motility-associated C-terminal domain-containing protein [Bacteroidales bacterium]|nr:gliding motility-associated C-terminal domain-containing protein [Bacteroidales bacterium]
MKSHIFKLLLLFTVINMTVLSLNGQTTFRSISSGIWSDGSTWTGGVAPGPNDNAIISSENIVTISGSDVTINNLTIETGGLLDATSNTLTVNGKLLVDGAFTSSDPGAQDLLFNGDSLGGRGVIKTDFADREVVMSTNALVLPSSDLKIEGKVSVGNSVTITNRSKIEITGNLRGLNASTSVWTNDVDSYLAIGGNLMVNGIMNTSSTGNTIEYNNFGDQDVILPASAIYHNLKFRGAGNKTLAGSITVNGDLEIYNSASLVSNNHNITISGSWKNLSNFDQGSGQVSFTGSSGQTIANPEGEAFYNFSLNKAAGELLLDNDIIIENTLTMLAGIINTQSAKMTLGTGTGSGQLGSMSYFGGFVRGRFERWINNTGSHEFPVGNANIQRLVINLNGLNSGGTLIAEFKGLDPGNNGLPLDDDGVTVYNTFSEGYWSLEPGNGFSLGSFNSYSLRLTGTGFTSFTIDEATRILARGNETAGWLAEGSHVNAFGLIARRSNLQTLPAQYAFGDDTDCEKPATSTISGTADVCAGETGLVYSVTDNPPNTYEWSVTGGLIVSGNNTSSITVDWGTTAMDDASVSVVEINTCARGAAVVLPVTMHSVPPSSITGSASVAEYSSGIAYSVPERTGYTYTWTVTGGSQASGGNTGTITVDWGPAGKASLSVVAQLPGCPPAQEVVLNVSLYDVIESVQTGFWDDPSTWDCACVPVSTDNVRINTGHTVTLRSAGAVEANNLVIEPGAIVDYNNLPLTVQGDFIVKGSYQGGSDSDLSLDGTDTEISGGGSIVGGLLIPEGNKTIPSTAALTISAGDISLGASVFVTNNGEISLVGDLAGGSSSSTWINNENSTLEISGALLTTGSLRAFADGNTVYYNGGAQAVKTPLNSIYHDLHVGSSGIKTLTNSLTIEGDLEISGTSSLDVSPSNYNISIAGNWTNTGNGLNPRSSVVTFNGLTDQAISGSETFYNLAYLNTGGNLILSDDVVVENNLQMAGGDIISGTNVITIGTGAAGVGSLTHVSGIVRGKMERWINTFGSTLFPVGITGSYHPASLYVNLLNSPGSVIVEFIPADPGSGGLPLLDGTTDILYHFTEGYWNFTAANGFDAANYNLDLQATGFSSYPLNINSRILSRTNNLDWVLDGNHVTASVPNIYRDFMSNGLSALGTQFGIAYACAPYIIDAVITQPSCFGYDDGAITVTPSGGASPYTYLWSPGGETTDNISGLSAGNYSVEVTDALGCVTVETFNVSQPTEIIIDYLVSNVECKTDDDGAIDISVSGGTEPYTYVWSTADGSGLSFNDEDQTGLTGGTYTVTVIDENSCTSTEDIVVIVEDNTAPVIICPPALTAICDISEQPAYSTYDEFTAAGGTATDNCEIDPDSFIMLSETTDGSSCPEILTRTYQISDDNGNSQTCTQLITVDDDIPPATSNPATINVECDSEVPAPDISVVTDATDNCGAPVVAFVGELSDGNSCPETITRTYSVTDACGNSITVRQLIVVNDITPPTASTPASVSVECPADVPLPDISVITDATDNCTANPVVAFVEDVSDGNTCPEVITRRYSITDDCGNTSIIEQIISIEDITDPSASNPPPISVACLTDVPLPDISVVTDAADNCTAAPLVAWEGDASDGNTCPETIMRTYSVTDECGNSINVSQTITINDGTPPTASNPAPVTVECPADIPLPDISVVTDAADNCTSSPAVAFVGDVSDGNTCPEVITRTYSVTDACGNTINVSQVITVQDLTPPTASNPAAVSVECLADVPPPDISVVSDAADNCGAPVVAFVGEISDGNTCPETIIRTYSVSDACGNSINVQQTITVDDITDPVISNCPADITVPADPVSCDAAVSWTEPTASDNCSLASFTTSHAPGTVFAIGTTSVTYTAVDDCGNTATCSFNVNVIDDEAPVITTCAGDKILSADADCEALVPDLTGEVVASDNCSPAITVSQDPVAGTIISSGTTQVTLSVTDGSGNSAFCYANINVVDDAEPVVVTIDTTVYIGAGNIVNIDSSYVFDDIASYDNCGITSVTIDINTFDCTSLGPNIINVTAYDGAGNSSAGTATVMVRDTTAVTAYSGPDDFVYIEDGSYNLDAAVVENGTVLWGSLGDGTFNDPTLVNPVYTLGPSDTESVILYMDVIPIIGCTPVSDTIKLTVSERPQANAGADATVCASEISYTVTDASSQGGTILWTTSGDGSFDDATLENPVYTFGAGDISSGSVTLTLTVTGLFESDSDDKIIAINELPGILVNEHSDISCNGLTDGVIRISGTGGLAPYSYSLNGAPYQSSGEFTALSAGDYDISVIDDNGCSRDTLITIIDPGVLSYSLDDVTHCSCFGAKDGSINISISGGTQPYLVNWTGPGGFTSSEEDLAGISAGLYTLNLTDANYCDNFILEVIITSPPQIVITPVSMSDYNGYGVSCYGETDGYINVSVSGGTGALSISWEGPGGFSSSSEDISGLEAGTYTITVTDELACSTSYEFNLNGPEELLIDYTVTDASCPDEANGAIDLEISGGVPTYTFLWDGATTEDRSSVFSGYYPVQVTDANGCSAQTGITVDFVGENCLEVSEVITPGVVDGKNDYLVIRNIDLYPNAEIKIYNRWGQLIFSAGNLDENRWDGTYRGKALPVDSYHYILDLGDGSSPRTGTITIIR